MSGTTRKQKVVAPSQLSQAERNEMMGALQTSITKLKTSRQIVGALNLMRKRIWEKLDTACLNEPMTAATAILQWAADKDLLTWQQLRVLGVQKIDFVEVYLDAFRKTQNTDPFAPPQVFGPPYALFYQTFPELNLVFLKELKLLVLEHLRKEKGGDKKKRTSPRAAHEDAILALKKARDFGGRGIIDDDRDEYAFRIMEDCLLADNFVVGHLKKIFQLLHSFAFRAGGKNCKWLYKYPESSVRILGKKEEMCLKKASTPKNCMLTVQSFCGLWCIESISNRFGSKNRDGMYIRIMRPSVRIRQDATGFDVFFPKFYVFSHLRNMQDMDFAPLKEAMNTIFDSGRVQFAKAATKRKALELYAEYKKTFPSKKEAGEAVLKNMHPRIGLSTLKSIVSSAIVPLEKHDQRKKVGKQASIRGNYALADVPDASSARIPGNTTP